MLNLKLSIYDVKESICQVHVYVELACNYVQNMSKMVCPNFTLTSQTIEIQLLFALAQAAVEE